MVLTIIVLSAVLGVGAFSTDMAILYAEKSNLQNAVDASALAGAQELPKDPNSAYLAAVQYASNNNAELTSIEITNSNKQIRITAEKEVTLYLARIIGINSSNVSAHAKAAVFSANSLKGVAPLSVTMQNFVFGQQYTLKNGGGDGTNGWYGPVRLDGSGANLYRNALTRGNLDAMSVGQILEIESGNMSGPTTQGLRDRLSSDTRVPGNTFEDHDRNAPQIVYIPIVEVMSSVSGSVKTVKILGFAAFFIENVSGSGGDCFITGRFIETLVSQGRETSPLSPSDDNPFIDYGLYSVKLLMN